MVTHRTEPVEILLVEDDPGHARLIQLALAEIDGDLRLRQARNGEQALIALRAAGARLPDLVLLDLNLPGLCGHEVLEAIRSDARLRDLRVVVLSTSTSASDVRRAEELGVAAYVAKPSDYVGMVDSLRGLELWSQVPY